MEQKFKGFFKKITQIILALWALSLISIKLSDQPFLKVGVADNLLFWFFILAIFIIISIIEPDNSFKKYLLKIDSLFKKSLLIWLIVIFFEGILMGSINLFDVGLIFFFVEMLLIILASHSIKTYLTQKKFNGCGNGGCHCKK